MKDKLKVRIAELEDEVCKIREAFSKKSDDTGTATNAEVRALCAVSRFTLIYCDWWLLKVKYLLISYRTLQLYNFSTWSSSFMLWFKLDNQPTSVWQSLIAKFQYASVYLWNYHPTSFRQLGPNHSFSDSSLFAHSSSLSCSHCLPLFTFLLPAEKCSFPKILADDELDYFCGL